MKRFVNYLLLFISVFFINMFSVYANNISFIFNNCPKVKGALTIYNNPTRAFTDAATASDSGITVNYTSDVTNVDNIIATKSSDSNIVKGSLVSNS